MREREGGRKEEARRKKVNGDLEILLQRFLIVRRVLA